MLKGILLSKNARRTRLVKDHDKIKVKARRGVKMEGRKCKERSQKKGASGEIAVHPAGEQVVEAQ
jgi:hypothetical protein